LINNIVINGDLSGVPVLALHTTGDGSVQVQQEDAHRDVVQSVTINGNCSSRSTCTGRCTARSPRRR
jgi:hypothetical protein